MTEMLGMSLGGASWERMLEYALGGHNPPYLVSAAKTQELKSKGGLIVGAMKNIEYEANVLMLGRGDTFFLYTDGITEAMNKSGAMYESGRLQQRLQAGAGLAPEQLVRSVIQDVQAFAGDAQQSDDMTCQAVTYFGPPAG